MRTRRSLLGGCAGLLTGCVAPSRRHRFDPLADRPLDHRAFAQFQGDVRNRGYADRHVPDAVRVDWSLPVNGGEHTAAKSSPVPTPDGDVIICGDTGQVRRVGPDGRPRWTAAVDATRRGIHGTPAIANDTVYVGAYDGALYAFALADGTRRWRRPLGDAIGSSPVYLDGILYVAVEYVAPKSGAVAAVHAGTGEQVWGDNRPTDHPHSTVGIDREAGRLIVGANDGWLYAWTFPGLERAWRFETGGPIKGAIAIADGLAVAGSWDGRIYAVDISDGREVWSVETAGRVMTSPAIDPGGRVSVGSQDGTVYAIDAATGDTRWTYDTGGWLIGGVTATPGHVLVGSYTDRLYALGTETGRPTWAVAGSGNATSAPLVTDDAIYYAERSEDGVPGRCYRLTPA